MVGDNAYSTSSYDFDDAQEDIPIVHAVLSPVLHADDLTPTAPSFCYDESIHVMPVNEHLLMPMLPPQVSLTPTSPRQVSDEQSTAHTPLQTNQVQDAQVLLRDPHPNSDRARKRAAGVATGVLGFILGGPMMAVVFGFGSAMAADTDGAAGDIARAVGDVAIVAQVKAKEVNDKHHLILRSKAFAADCIKKAQEANHKHRFLTKAKSLFKWPVQSVARIVEAKCRASCTRNSNLHHPTID